MRPEPCDVLCLGEAMIELALDPAAPDPAVAVPAAPDRARLSVAGDVFNTAVYLKRSAPGLRVGFATRIGTDGFSDRIMAAMAAEGLGADRVGRSDTRGPGLYAIETDAAGERRFTYWRDRSAAREMIALPPRPDDLAGAAVLYLSGITLAVLSAAARRALLDWLPGYRAAGGRVAFDSNYRPALWPDAATAREAIAAAWAQTDIGFPSLDDEMVLFGSADARAVRDRLRAAGVAQGALKRGAAGPLALEGGPEGDMDGGLDGGLDGEQFPAAAQVVDSTAAGDSFNAGYLAAVAGGAGTAAAMAAGHRLAATVVRYRGAIIPMAAMPGPAIR